MRLFSLVIVAAATSLAAGLTSAWRTDAIAIDGLPGEWQRLEPLERGPAVAAANDNEFLYLVVSARDPEAIAHVAGGLIVWLDPSGRRAETFGLRIPGVDLKPLPGMNPTAPATPTGIRATVLDQFDVLGPGQNQRRLVDLTPDLAIEIASSFSEHEVVYEMKVPLQKTAARPYAVAAAPGRTIGLGIATPQAPTNRGERPRLVGDTGWIGGSPWTGGGFAKYREKDGSIKPLQIWTTLALSARN